MVRPTHVAVVGAGSWGTTVAAMAARNVPTVVWARRPALAFEIDSDHVNGDYLPGAPLPAGLRATASLERAVQGADVLVMAVPSHGFREVLEQLAPCVRPLIPVVSLAKGLEQQTQLRMTQIVEDVLPGHPAGVLMGPNIAVEVIRGYAAAAVLSMPDERPAAGLQAVFRTPLFRVYAGDDVVGAELGAAFKNVFAIAAGMAQGLGAGDNTRATLITRSLAELTRLGVACGGRAETFAGLTGMGDLLATCMSPHSRNRALGQRLAEGDSLDDAITGMQMVAEGVRTSRVVIELARAHGVEMPIAEEVYAVIGGLRTPDEALRGLLRTTPTTELAAG
jgi:glycerol-3-phosphate dehydrogenase (NAD(P)+)